MFLNVPLIKLSFFCLHVLRSLWWIFMHMKISDFFVSFVSYLQISKFEKIRPNLQFILLKYINKYLYMTNQNKSPKEWCIMIYKFYLYIYKYICLFIYFFLFNFYTFFVSLLLTRVRHACTSLQFWFHNQYWIK